MESYLQLLRDVLSKGEKHSDRTGVGTTSLFGYQWRHYMGDGTFPLLTTKYVPFRLVLSELLWFLSGSTNCADLKNQNCHIWDEWATADQCNVFDREENDLGPIYGALWRNYPIGDYKSTSFDYIEDSRYLAWDQITWLISEIRSNPNSRRLIVSGWHPYWQTRVTLPPCHTLWQIKCHSNKEMSLHLYARSIDAFLGLPFNIASYGLLLRMLCFVLGYTCKDLIISFGDLHIYNNHLNQVEEQLSRECKKLPYLRITGGCFDTFSFDDFELLHYQHGGKLPAPVAV